MDGPSPTRPATLAARLLLVALFTTWIWQGPIRKVIFEEKGVATWSWRMFATAGKKSCDVRYYRRDATSDTYVERWKVFGHESPWHMPRAIRLVHPDALDHHTTLLCRTLAAAEPGAVIDIRADIRCPYRKSWRVLEDRTRDVCHSESQKQIRARKKRERARKKARAEAKRAARRKASRAGDSPKGKP